MRILVCTTDASPCPPGDIVTMAVEDAFNPTDLGITPETVLYVYSWGVAAVLSLWCVGYAIGAAVSMIRKA